MSFICVWPSEMHSDNHQSHLILPLSSPPHPHLSHSSNLQITLTWADFWSSLHLLGAPVKKYEKNVHMEDFWKEPSDSEEGVGQLASLG